MGIPRYGKEVHLSARGNWKTLDITCITRGFEFQPIIWHFLLFTTSPHASKKESNTCLNMEEIITDAPPSNRVSYENCKWFIFLTPQTICKPSIFPTILSWSSFMLKVLEKIMKRRGERKHPWCNPMLILKNYVSLTFTRGEIQGLLMQESTHFIKLELNANRSKTWKRKPCLTW